MIAPFIINPDSETGLISNQLVCNIEASMFVWGTLGVVNYTMGLTLFYLMVVKHNVSDNDFASKFEKHIHVGAILGPVSLITTFILTDSFNPLPDGQMCYVNSAPLGCAADPDVDCTRGIHAFWMGIFLHLIPCILCIIGILTCLTKLVMAVVTLERRASNRFRSTFTVDMVDGRNDDTATSTNQNGRRSFRESLAASFDTLQENFGIIRAAFFENSSGSNSNSNGNHGNSATVNPRNVRTRGAQRARQRTIDTTKQAILYSSVFIFLAPLPMIALSGYYWKGISPNPGYSIFFHLVFPLNGFLNLMIFTRPNVQTVMNRRPRFSRLRAMWEVTKAGGGVPAHITPISASARRRGQGQGVAAASTSLGEEDGNAGGRNWCCFVGRMCRNRFWTFFNNEELKNDSTQARPSLAIVNEDSIDHDQLGIQGQDEPLPLPPQGNDSNTAVKNTAAGPPKREITAREMVRRISLAVLDSATLDNLMQEDFHDDESCVVSNNGDEEMEGCEVFLPDATSTTNDDSILEQDAASGEDINSGDVRKSTDSLSNSSVNDELIPV